MLRSRYESEILVPDTPAAGTDDASDAFRLAKKPAVLGKPNSATLPGVHRQRVYQELKFGSRTYNPHVNTGSGACPPPNLSLVNDLKVYEQDYEHVVVFSDV